MRIAISTRTFAIGRSRRSATFRRLQSAGNAASGLTTREIEAAINLRPSLIEKALKLLVVEDAAPILRDGNKWFRTANRYSMDAARMEVLTRQREIEWAQMSDYMASRTCLMQFLARALDDETALPAAAAPCAWAGRRWPNLHNLPRWPRRSASSGTVNYRWSPESNGPQGRSLITAGRLRIFPLLFAQKRDASWLAGASWDGER